MLRFLYYPTNANSCNSARHIERNVSDEIIIGLTQCENKKAENST